MCFAADWVACCAQQTVPGSAPGAPGLQKRGLLFARALLRSLPEQGYIARLAERFAVGIHTCYLPDIDAL